MAKPNSKPALLDELRSALKDQYATAHRDFTPREPIAWGVDWLDDKGIQKGELCEISFSSMAAGAVFLGQIVRSVILENHQRLMLIDGSDSFDPATLPIFGQQPESDSDLDGLFAWARCRNVQEAVQVADLVLRDGNLPRTVIDLQNNTLREIAAFPRSSWLRLRALAEDAGGSCIIITPRPIISCIRNRFGIETTHSLDDLAFPESQWGAALTKNAGVHFD